VRHSVASKLAFPKASRDLSTARLLINHHPITAAAILRPIPAARRTTLDISRSNRIVRQNIPAVALIPVFHPAQREAEPSALIDT
jgi:hypothetical protein